MEVGFSRHSDSPARTRTRTSLVVIGAGKVERGAHPSCLMIGILPSDNDDDNQQRTSDHHVLEVSGTDHGGGHVKRLERQASAAPVVAEA